jgi:microcystin-dependent protein
MNIVLNRERGAGLIEMIIAAGIGAAVLAGVTYSLTGLMKTSNKANTSMDIVAVKAKILNSVRCEQTLSTPCTDGTYIDLKDSSNRVVVSASGSNLGKFFVRALCHNSGSLNGIDVRAAWLSDAGRTNPNSKVFTASNPVWFMKDETNSNLPYNWNHPKDKLFSDLSGSDAMLCGPTTIGGTVPPGGIIMWSGGVVPAGWALCDGTAGTPDLRNRFILAGGAGSSYAVGSVGGGASVTASVSIQTQNMPSHTHATSSQLQSYKVAVSHPGRPGPWVSLGYANPNSWGGGYESLEWIHNPTVSVDASGGSQPLTISVPATQPQYYALAYIMKLP